MNTQTGEVGYLHQLLQGKGIPAHIVPIDITNLSPRVRKMVEETGRGWVTRNSKCPCGSGKRFKRCCMSSG